MIDGQLVSRAASAGWTYTSVTVSDGYVDPNDGGGVPAQDYFEYDRQDGSIAPSQAVSEEQRSMALRTIYDVGLDEFGLSGERYRYIEDLKVHIAAKGTQRATQELNRLLDRHQRRDPKDMRGSVAGPAVRFTGLVLFAASNGWFV